MLVPVNKDGDKLAKKDWTDDDKESWARAEEHDKGVRITRHRQAKTREAALKELG